jgi:N6-adenosine-specific RNA methylase IME4
MANENQNIIGAGQDTAHRAPKKYRTILVDPPWSEKLTGKYSRRRNQRPTSLPYKTMSYEELEKMQYFVRCQLPADSCHLWLWTTNQFLHDGFHLMQCWGFKYLAPIHWIKPSGCGNYFVHRSQTLLFGYKGKCDFKKRFMANLIFTSCPTQHSKKPNDSYELIEAVSHEPRIELFARPVTPLFPKRPGWDVWGDEIESDVNYGI